MDAATVRTAALALALSAVGLLAASAPASATPEAALKAIEAAAPPCPAGRARCVGLHLHVVLDAGGEAVQAPAWVAEQLREANRLFEPVGVGFELTKVSALAPESTNIETRADRDRLGRRRHGRGVVHVFLVGKLANVDEPGVIRGVHWRDRADRERRWVILSKIAPPMVLAHELGHFFGLPHSTYAVSIMNKTPREEPPYAERGFHADEVARMKRRLSAMLKSKELVDR